MDELPTLAAQALAQGLSPSTSVVGGTVLDELLSAGFLAPVGPGPSQATLDGLAATREADGWRAAVASLKGIGELTVHRWSQGVD